MKMVKKVPRIISLYTLAFLFVVVQALSSYDKISTSQFVNNFLGSKKGDKVQRLNKIKKYLTKYGYLDSSTMTQYQPSHDTWDNSDILDHDLEDAIKKFQHYFNLNVSGILDRNTLSLMAKPRCEFPDLVNKTSILHGVKLVQDAFNGSYYVLTGKKWSKRQLSWAVRPRTRTDAIIPIFNAFKSWASVTRFHFAYKFSVSYHNSDVKIAFYSGEHGDRFPFTGVVGSLAHSSFPPSGELHFNNDVNWVIGAKSGGIDIETVALHEIGHILGLTHSAVEAAIMYPVTNMGETKLSLHADDIAGIRALYNFH